MSKIISSKRNLAISILVILDPHSCYKKSLFNYEKIMNHFELDIFLVDNEYKR